MHFQASSDIHVAMETKLRCKTNLTCVQLFKIYRCYICIINLSLHICVCWSFYSINLGIFFQFYHCVATLVAMDTGFRSILIFLFISFKTRSISAYSLYWHIENSKRVWSGNTTITDRRQPHGTTRKSHSTITRHQEDKLSKTTSSLFPSKMIAIIEWTLSNVQQNIEQLQTPTMGVTINEKSTTTEPPP